MKNGDVDFFSSTKFCLRHEYVPGYILPSSKMLIVAYGTGTKFLQDYEVLVSDHPEYLHWRKASSGLPLRPVTGGCDSKG